MRNKHIRFLKNLIKDSNPAGGSNHAALIYRGNSILSWGVNSYKPNSFLAQFKNLPEWFVTDTGHAEMAAVQNFLKNRPYSELSTCNLMVIRVKSGQLVNSRPCQYCDTVLTKLKLKSITYSG